MAVSDKTILFVTSRLPYPTSSGRKTSLYHYCRIISEKLNYRLVVASFLESGDLLELKPDFIDRLVVLPNTHILEKFKNIVCDSILKRKKPIQVSIFWNKTAKHIVDNLVKEEKPEIVIGDMIRCTEYIKDIQAIRIADLDDLISLRYKRQLALDLDGINPYGAFLNTVPKVIQKIVLCKSFKLYIVKKEIDLLKSYELYIAQKCEHTMLVAKHEADKLNLELQAKKAIAVPIGVDTEYFSYIQTKNTNNYIAFLGALNVAHNDHAAKNFIKNVLPLIVKVKSDVKLFIIGGGASEDLLNLQSSYVEFTGYVDDVRPYLAKCKVFVCPLTFGSGIKTKNLEAMACGLPVVTTSIGAENIDAVNGRDWLICDTNTEMANSIVRLLNNEKDRKSISYNARNYIENNFTWECTMRSLKQLFKEAEK